MAGYASVHSFVSSQSYLIAVFKPVAHGLTTPARPSGRPGNPPFCYLRLNITDPNEFNLGKTHYGDAIIDPSSTQCNLQWDCLQDTIWGQVTSCSPTQAGLWTFKVLVPAGNSSRPSATADFDLRFTLINKMIMNDDVKITQKYVGQQHFAVGKNMNGACGGSSVCNWGLIENTTVDVTQKLVE